MKICNFRAHYSSTMLSYVIIFMVEKMNYIKINLILNNPLAFWASFSESERFFWFDPQKETFVIGCERLKAIDLEHDKFSDYPYLFHSQTFFDDIKGELWKNFGGETIAFKHYFVVNKENSYTLTCDSPRVIPEITFPKFKHQLTEKASDFSAWQELFYAIQKNFADGKSRKIVASRELEFTSQTSFELESIIQNLLDNNPNAFIFAYQKGKRIFLGASPEILVQKENDQLLSYALAGTFPKTMENAGQKLLTDPKNLLEHDIVVQKIKRNLLEKAETVKVGTTELMELKNVYHLRTILSAKNSELSLIDWTKQLHPTPALGGEPRHEALEFLRKHENHERGLYAAPLGLIDSKGNGTMIVGIRSALIVEKKLYAYAGCGIIPSSDALEEFRETKVKLKTILEAL